MIRVGEETVPSLLVFPPESGPDIDLPRDFLKLLLDLLTRELFTGRHEWDTPGVIRLSDVFDARTPPGAEFVYLYDFGDGWEHAVRLERLIEHYDRTCAQVTLMEGDAPPEDCGGPGGFSDMLAILSDERHPDHAHMKEWAVEMGWRPLAEGDMEKVNRGLANREYWYYRY